VQRLVNRRHAAPSPSGDTTRVSMILLLTTIGVVVFRESLNHFEMAGIVLAVASLVLLIRFA
jgi:drug/metabolite transporter (DMT)-like permease